MKTTIKKAIHHLLCLVAYGQFGCFANLLDEDLEQSEATVFHPKPMLF